MQEPGSLLGMGLEFKATVSPTQMQDRNQEQSLSLLQQKKMLLLDSLDMLHSQKIKLLLWPFTRCVYLMWYKVDENGNTWQ